MSSDTSKTSTYTRDPDIVVWDVRGTITADDVRELFAVSVRFAEGKSGIFLLVLANGYQAMDSEARRLIVEVPKMPDGSPLKTLATATVGASFHVRVAGTMVAKASAVLTKGSVSPIQFVDTEEQALAWIAEQRRQ